MVVIFNLNLMMRNQK
ncbi:UNVERIFIED_CONTAM: hypothetical protein GTU68_026047 [Idotea baltica]|nr:hypothetical protein [Idotea baltica]